MTGPDLIRLAEELAAAGGMHRLTSLVTAAVHVTLEHERRRHSTVEAWEDEPCGAGMSDRVVVSRRVEAVPASAERSGLYAGNVLSEEERAARLRGITHGPDSPVAREFGRPIDPTIAAEGTE